MKKLGLALSSGGARGFAHLGVIKVLEKHNIPIHCISGTSMGAIMAAYYALYQETEKLEKIASEFRKRDILKLVDLNDPRVSIVKGEKVRNFLNEFFEGKTFEDTKIPLAVSATTLEEGKEVVFKSGNIMDAIIPSGTVPGVFPAREYKGKHLVDGGLADATPVDLCEDLGAEAVIAVNLYNFTNTENRNYKNMKEVLFRTYEIIMTKLSEYRIKEYKENILVLRPKTGNKFQTFSFHHAKDNVEAGIRVAEENIDKIKKLIE